MGKSLLFPQFHSLSVSLGRIPSPHGSFIMQISAPSYLLHLVARFPQHTRLPNNPLADLPAPTPDLGRFPTSGILVG